jgi:hypothetical protein
VLDVVVGQECFSSTSEVRALITNDLVQDTVSAHDVFLDKFSHTLGFKLAK